MKSRMTLTGLAAALSAAALLSVPLPALTQDVHQPGQSAPATHQLKMNQGKKWATDEALRKGMTEIRGLIDAQLPAIKKGRLKPEDYAALGSKVQGQVGYIVQNCKLDPQADANRHIILEDIIAGADAMEGKDKKVNPHAGTNKAVAGLNTYGKYFDHPNWKGL